MKQRAPKLLLFLLVLFCLSSVLFISAGAEELTEGDFVFTVNGSSATVKEYIGSDENVTIPSKVGNATVTTIGNEAFWSNKTIKTVTIPSTVKVIGTAAFNECTSLTRIVLPSKLTTLGSAAFWYCTNLKQVFIPKSLTYLGENAFTGCHKNLTVYVIKGSYGETAISSLNGINMAYRYITDLALSSSSLKLQAGTSSTLSYTYAPEKVYYSKVSYTSDNTSVATVDANGKITAVAPGIATISCTTKDGGKITAICTVTVIPEKVSGFYVTDLTPTSYTLNWGKSDGATKYRVYRYNSSSKKYETIIYTKETSLTLSDIKPGTCQYYKVLAYTSINGKNYLAPTSSAFKTYAALPGKVTQITAKPAHNFINLSWEKSDYATGYRIYLYNRETSKYTFLKATTATSYKVKGLEANTCYTFMVRAYMKEAGTYVYASYSPLQDCTTRPDYITNVKAKENSVFTSRLTLCWETQEKADGYQIRQYNEDGSWETVATIDNGNTGEYTLSGLSPATTYGYTVRAYVTYDSGNLYGYFASVPVYITTNDRPADEAEAYKGFTEALNTTLLSQESFTVVKINSSTQPEDIFLPENIAEAIAFKGTTLFYITDGFDKETGTPIINIISPDDDEIEIPFTNVSEASYEDDGNGYRISFTLSSQDVTKLFTADNFNGSEDFTASFGEGNVTAKIHNGYIDDITVTVPVTISFTFNSEEYSFTKICTQTYLFIR